MSNLTDIDRGFIKTFIDLFRNPSKVVQSYINEENTYTNPVRYAITVIPISFIIMLFVSWLIDE